MPREEEYDKKFYKDIEQKIDRMDEKQKANFIMDLAVLNYSVKFSQKEAIRDQIHRYFLPKNENGELDKPLFEQRMRNMADLRIEKMYKPAAEFAAKNQKEHSDKWIWEQLRKTTKTGAYSRAYGDLVWGNDKVMNTIKKAYPNYKGSNFNIWWNMNLNALEGAVNARKDKPSLVPVVSEGLRFTASQALVNSFKKTDQELETERIKQQNDKFMSKDEAEKAEAMNFYSVNRDMDLSFISSTKTYEAAREKAESRISGNEQNKRDIDKYMDEFSESLKNSAAALKKISGFRWNDSDAFNQVKDDLADLQEMLKKGNSRENREEILGFINKFRKDCKDYQDKNPGVRGTDRGNKRKEVVGNIQKLLDDGLQKVLAPELEADRIEIMRQKNQEVTRALEKESMDRVKESFQEKLSFKELSKEEGSKTTSKKPEKVPEKEKEKAPEARRKSMSAGGAKK